MTLPSGFQVRREYGNLIFSRRPQAQEERAVGHSATAQIPGQTRFGDYLIEAAVLDAEANADQFTAAKTRLVECFDLDKLHLPLEVRFRRAGERFIPLGQTAEKKVGKFLTAQRVPEEIRKRTLIVADSEKVIWVWPIRISEQAKITDATRRILRLRITDTGPAGEKYEQA
jgi:tRNA(Ile)-lysidine synthase